MINYMVKIVSFLIRKIEEEFIYFFNQDFEGNVKFRPMDLNMNILRK